MDPKTGEILTKEQAEALGRDVVPMKEMPTKVQMLRRPPRVGRNEPCPCSSGRKFKHCCWTGH